MGLKQTTFQIAGAVTISGTVNAAIASFSQTTAAMTVASQAAVTVNNNVSTTLLAANAARKLVMITNTSGTFSLFVAFGTPASATSGVEVKPGATLTLESNELRNWQGDIRGFQISGSNLNICMVEFQA